ncbi:penicillin-binding transpeptidase domain-containing protein [Deinococcus deserti]|uniref:beta-lactamase n=1 Tax=Deinococcus deserti (strain DSM 17065 / CIP 109153 / LMG 22923 / VCD115) TaxID=546414 RepID=C1CUW4_DEIDV|nr:penicillin-binding transpeptidase domain-containing protein [Deinococcus deserti]ACO45981.1 putative Penicillin-binding protein 2/cell division protein FtsI; putative Peptidoglycan glycosyltransferase [Deinococcus deserti VCD115]
MSRVRERRQTLRRRAGGGTGQERAASAPNGRVRIMALAFTLGLVGMGARLYQLQVTQHSQFAVQSTSNYQRDEVLRAMRGEIRTRDGLLLATNRLAVDLVYTGRRDPSDPEQAIPSWDKIRYLAGIKEDVLVDGQPREPDPRKEPDVILARNVPEERLAALYEYVVLVPSLELRQRVERIYPEGKLAGHLLGYVSEANAREVEEGNYTVGDLVGRSGLEYSLQTTLQGKNGLRRREVTANGRPQTERVLDQGVKGQDVTLTLDSLLQRTAETALREGLTDINAGRAKWGKPAEKLSRGAVIAFDPRTNEVLAMASSPAYDPNWFSRVPSPDHKAKNWAVDPNRPDAALDAVTSNRVVQAYNPGSVFKIATTLMYIEKWGNFSIHCAPSYYFGRARFNNWARFSLGMVDGRLAISYSCNPWYYHSAALATPGVYSRQLKSRLTELGYNRTTGLELVGEKTGRLSNIDDYTTPEAPWFPGFGLIMSIGQGDVLVTPAQVAWVMSTIINNGQQRPMTVLKAVGGKEQPRKPVTSVVRNGNTDVFKLVQEGMAGTTAGTRYGTAIHEVGPLNFPVRTGGKTGTAENGRSYRDGYAYTHAWYEGYGPIGKDGKPTFAVVAFFQNGGEGSGPALRAVKRMFAARWCVKLDERLSALPLSEQQPCLGELEDMRRVYAIREARGASTPKP